MADLIAFHNYYSRHSLLSPSTMLPRASSHKRSNSSENRSLSPDRTLTKAKSANDLATILSTNRPNSTTRSTSVGNFADSGFSTLKDPRLGSHSEASESSSPQSHHPDLSSEVAALSVKLVEAINTQTILDDNLVATRQELERAQTKLKSLETDNEKYQRDIDQEILVKKTDVDYELLRLKAALADEKAQRALVEKEKKGIEQELETLTAALFEEANKMVAAAKLEREAVEKKNEQLRSQVKDTEALLASHQEQLAELKSVLQVMNVSKDDIEARTITSTAPSSPTGTRQFPGIDNHLVESPAALEPVPCPEEFTPGPCTSFPHLIKTVCRTDIQAFEDFRELFVLTCTSKPPSRAASGSYGGLNVMSLASLGGGSFGSSTSSPVRPQAHSPNGSMSSPQPATNNTPLKETRFYKRALSEDIEPTLRLDAAPGISWLTRRSVLSGICEGSLVVEPMPQAARKYEFPCSLCGERRTGPVNERTHRFRTSDNETAQRYPLCVLCLERVRSCCEFTGYLRMILDGHVRVSEADEEKDAWEETVRLRERMFWSRICGGIIPVVTPTNGFEETPTSLAERQEGDIPDHRNGEHETSMDIDRESGTEDPFVSAESESPASSVAVSASHDSTDACDQESVRYEVSEHSTTTVTADVGTKDDSESPLQVEESTVTETVVSNGVDGHSR
ncbi:rab guanine nucleotide exchange factor S2 [Aspergillus nanangensis]|uniref:Rab guanine nucleotide exchange factor S2 n=1 Tax=Aspergillus nanangensis TaxID=2582783 RepID=A0AAD4GUE6_ASPNN|nr:rab guanine nucleotide exchange factor S2 [Aspergillus nanangensis]